MKQEIKEILQKHDDFLDAYELVNGIHPADYGNISNEIHNLLTSKLSEVISEVESLYRLSIIDANNIKKYPFNSEMIKTYIELIPEKYKSILTKLKEL